MRRWPCLRVGVLAVALAVGVALPALHGCSGGAAPGTSRHDADAATLAADAALHLARFDAVYDTYATDPLDRRQLRQFHDAYMRVRSAYVHPVSDERLVDDAIAGVVKDEPAPRSLAGDALVEKALDAMTAALDPHSAYLDPDELREAELATTGEFGGLGIQVTQDDGRIKVIAPIEGTPAERAGIRPGDVITHVDGRPVAEMKLTQVVRAMRGEPGTRINLRVQRAAEKPFDLGITRAVIAIQPVRWRVHGNTGYVRIVSFSERTLEGLKASMTDVLDRLGPSANGIVLDLRNNPGGLFDQSIRVASAFLDGGVIVSVRGRDATQSRDFRAQPGDLARGLPMVVLINGGSASASEIVAGALQDHGRALVMGSPSFGKGSVQTVIRLPAEGALKLTTALYYAPSGETIQARGVLPDIVLKAADGPAATAREADLPRALPANGNASRLGRPEISAETCPAVGGDDDPELACAVGLLRAGSVGQFLSTVTARTAF